VRLEDFAAINEFAVTASLDDGVHIYRLCFTNSNSFSFVATNEKNEIIGIDIAHVLPVTGARIVFVTGSQVHKDYQGFGLWKSLLRMRQNLPGVAYLSPDALSVMPRYKLDAKANGYWGKPSIEFLNNLRKNDMSSFDILPLDEVNHLPDLLTYDRSVFNLDRDRFMREWCSTSNLGEPYARTLIAKQKSDGVILGFGTVRLFSRVYELQPLYADSDEVAEALLIELARLYAEVCGDEPLHIFCEASNLFMLRLVRVHRLNFKVRYCYFRVFDELGTAEEIRKYIRYDRAYGMMFYWPV